MLRNIELVFVVFVVNIAAHFHLQIHTHVHVVGT